jgi:hypothetical protein
LQLTNFRRIRRYSLADSSLILTNIEAHRRSAMTACTLTPTVTAPLGTRLLRAAQRYFARSVVTRDAIDQAWIDSGLGRLSRATLEDIGAPPAMLDDVEQRQAWRLAAALDATRLL